MVTNLWLRLWLTETAQFHVPPARFIAARAEQPLEHYVSDELLNVAALFTDLGRMETRVELSAGE